MGSLPFDLPPRRKRKRGRRVSSGRRLTPEPEQASLFRAPDVQRCGLCGATVTVLETVTACPSCGAIVSRRERSRDDE